MEVKVTVGITPALEKILLNLSKVLGTQVSNFEAKTFRGEEGEPPKTETALHQAIPVTPLPISQQSPAPTQQVTQQAVQQVPVQQPAPQQTTQQQAQVQPQGVPTSAPSYTQEQLAVAATQLMDAGKQQDLIQLLSQFVNPPVLMNLPPEQYGAFATGLRGLGAKI